MSFLAHTLRASRAPTSRSLASRSSVAFFHNTSVTRALSEADSPASDDAQPSKIETHKQDSVSRAQAGQGEWKPELASESEQAVKGDRNGDDLTMEQMQKLGEKKAEQGKTPSGSSSSDKA